jgi:hypothetical protein
MYSVRLSQKWDTACREWGFPPCKARKNFSKSFEKPLDKPHKVWYNKDTPKGENKFSNAPTALVWEKEVHYG